ncbi:MAG: AbrB/MazE/SpoVT family DNA-binding domain-containing protein [Bacillota bacterium]
MFGSLGIIRRLDDIGRVVVPSELREVLGWKPGDPVEITSTQDGRIVLRKYMPVFGLTGIGRLAVQSLHELTRDAVFLASDRDVVFCLGAKHPHVMPRFLSRAMADRRLYLEPDERAAGCPILNTERGYVLGSIGLSSADPLSPEKVKFLGFVAQFLGKLGSQSQED